MTPREVILARIREALRVQAPRPGHQHPATDVASAEPKDFRHWLPRVGDSWDERRQLFAEHAAALRATFKVMPSLQAAADEIRAIASAGQWKKLATHAGALADAICSQLGLQLLHTDQPHTVDALEQCDGSVTACDALIAQTGSVLVSSRHCGGRAVSVLPPHHIVVAMRDQLLPDLPAAFELLRHTYDGNYPSMMSLITGPSRTGDIERILVLGAHGPKQLTILLIAD